MRRRAPVLTGVVADMVEEANTFISRCSAVKYQQN